MLERRKACIEAYDIFLVSNRQELKIAPVGFFSQLKRLSVNLDFFVENIKRAKESVAQMEETYKKADAQFKPMFQKGVDDAKKYLKEAEDPNNKQYVRYAKNYERSVQEAKEMNARNSADF